MVLAEALGNDPDSYIAAMVDDLDNRASESRLVDVEDEALVEVLRAREPPPRLPPVAPDPPQSTPTTAPGTVGRSELPLTAAAAPQLRKWPRRWILFQGAIVGVLIALWVATRESYFLGVDEARGDIVVVYQGLPYDLPLGAKLYSIHELSGVALQLVPVARRETFTDHRLRSREDAENLLLQLEQGSIAK
jgi:protein phosphatase